LEKIEHWFSSDFTKWGKRGIRDPFLESGARPVLGRKPSATEEVILWACEEEEKEGHQDFGERGS